MTHREQKRWNNRTSNSTQSTPKAVGCMGTNLSINLGSGGKEKEREWLSSVLSFSNSVGRVGSSSLSFNLGRNSSFLLDSTRLPHSWFWSQTIPAGRRKRLTLHARLQWKRPPGASSPMLSIWTGSDSMRSWPSGLCSKCPWKQVRSSRLLIQANSRLNLEEEMFRTNYCPTFPACRNLRKRNIVVGREQKMLGMRPLVPSPVLGIRRTFLRGLLHQWIERWGMSVLLIAEKHPSTPKVLITRPRANRSPNSEHWSA